MPETFDPLYEWLGIPPKDQPPNHYRLLGIELFESNLNVIERAADRQMSHVRTYQSGRHARDSQDLLNKLSAAKVCLLQPGKKAEYDGQLRAKLTSHDSASSMEIPADLSSLMPKAAGPVSTSAPGITAPVADDIVRVVEKPRRKLQKSTNATLVIGLVAAMVTILGGVAGWLIFGKSGDTPSTNNVVPAPDTKTTPEITNTTPLPGTSTNVPAPASPETASPTKTPPSSVAGTVNPDSTGTVPSVPTVPEVPENKKPPETPLSTVKNPPSPRAPVEMAAYNEVEQPPQEPMPRDPLPAPDPQIVQRISNAQGLINDDMAFCQTMPYDEFRDRVGQMREFFFRPIRVRPYPAKGMALVSAVWTRDTLPWRIVCGVSRAELESAHATMEREGYFLADVSGFDESGEEFTAVWAKASTPIPSRFLVGVDKDQYEQLRSSMNPGFVIRSSWRYMDQQGVVRFCVGYIQPSPKPAWYTFAGTNAFFARQLNRGLPIDLGHFRMDKGTRMTGILLTDDKRPYSITHGGTVAEHQQKCEEFVRQGLRPLTISVIERPEDQELEAASIWVPRDVGTFAEFREGISAPAVARVPPATTTPTMPAGVKDSPKKTAMPPKEAIDGAIARSRDVLKPKFTMYNTPLKQSPFSAELLASAREEADPPTKYALFLLARDVAVDAGDAWAAERALDGLANSFDTDIWPLRLEMVDKINPKSRTDVARRALAEVGLIFFQRAVAEEQFDVAEKFLGPARRFKDLSRVVAVRSKSLAPIRKLAESATQAEARLEQSPGDAEAHLTLGRFLCFVKDSWPQGLAHLAQCSDATLADLAKRDLANPMDVTSKNQLAEDWAAWAAKNSGEENMAAWQRAQWWLTSAGPERMRRRPANNKSKTPDADQSLAARLAEFGSFLPRWRGYDQPPGEVMQLEGHSGAVATISMARSGRWLVSGSRDDTIRVWDLTTGMELSRIPSSVDDVMSLALLPDEQTVVISGIRSKIVSANLVTRAELGSFDVESFVRELAVSADGRRMLQSRAAIPRNLLVSEINGAQPVFLPTQTSLRAIDLGRSGSIAACADDNNNVHVWDLRKPSAPVTLTGFSSFLADLAISPNEQLVAGCFTEGIVVWDLQSRTETIRIALPRGGQRIAFSFDSRQLITSSNTNDVTVVDVDKGTVIRTLTSDGNGSVGSCEALAVFPDGRGAVTAGYDGAIHVWRLPD